MSTLTCPRTADGPAGLCSFLLLGLQLLQSPPTVEGVGRAVHGRLHGDGGFRPGHRRDALHRLPPLFGSLGVATGGVVVVDRVIVAVAHVVKAKVLDLVVGAADGLVGGVVAAAAALLAVGVVETKQVGLGVRLGVLLGFALRRPRPAEGNTTLFSSEVASSHCGSLGHFVHNKNVKSMG